MKLDKLLEEADKIFGHMKSCKEPIIDQEIWYGDKQISIKQLIKQSYFLGMREMADALEEDIKIVCADEEVHCNASCHVCGGVGEFLQKLAKQRKIRDQLLAD